ncbi:dachshund2-like [Tropilaelaps mercedesae]|uniref:Dachshund2-like n=1 Tax=Tropilaelaps mercedesae TaxID=418985 RepID=A0A1V9XTD8_9ACAR|nr:dachshund2-like [Tropilaelaps mercedesae]
MHHGEGERFWIVRDTLWGQDIEALTSDHHALAAQIIGHTAEGLRPAVLAVRMCLDKRLQQSKESPSSSRSASEPPALNLTSSAQRENQPESRERRDSASSSGQDEGPDAGSLGALKVKLEQQAMLQLQQQQQQLHQNSHSVTLELETPEGLSGGESGAPPNGQSVENLLRNIQALLRLAAETARENEKRALIEKTQLKLEIQKERDSRAHLEKQLEEATRLRGQYCSVG